MEQIDYKEKYEQALQRARQFSEKPYLEDSAGIVEYIFPELRESEDERMKKALKNLVENCNRSSTIDGEISKADAIAWLEGQGEQKPTAEYVLIKAGLKPYKDGDQWCVLLGDNIQEGICGFGNTIEDALYAFLKDLIASQGEQKPVDFSDLRTWKYIVDAVLTEKEGIGQYLDSPFTEEVAKKLQKRFGNIKQNPAEWSAYDKATLEYIIEDIKELRDSETNEGSIETYERELNLLQAINESTKLSNYTNPAEWSEEDENNISDLCSFVVESYRPEDASSLITWLKSLKDRVQPQLKQEWSEEDEQLYNDLSDTYFYNDEDYPEETYKLMLKRVLDWMTKRAKPLRPQNRF